MDDSSSFGEPKVTIQIDQKNPIQPMGTVSGRVTLSVKNEKIIRGIVIHCNGDAIVQFMIPSGGKYESVGSQKQELYLGKEVFVNTWKYALGGARIREYKLTAGIQTFPFSFILPQQLSCSYHGEYGRVEYRIDVKIKAFGEREKDHVTSAIFQVFAPVNLNDYHDAWDGGHIAGNVINKYWPGLGCDDGLIGFVLNIPRSGFMPGEIIHFTGELVNTTKNWKVEEIQVRILQSEVFAAEGEKTWTKTPICVISYPGIGCGRIDRWEGSIGPLPPTLQPTKLGHCNIIKLYYWLQVIMIYIKPKSMEKEYLSEIKEIVIGNVPFNDGLQEDFLRNLEKQKIGRLRIEGYVYRSSSTEIIGDEPNIGYFVNYGERVGDYKGNVDEDITETILEKEDVEMD